MSFDQLFNRIVVFPEISKNRSSQRIGRMPAAMY